jgi:crotonobetainyl-CoA:carnitine CoA-transferase CaiB-like acyl-CoA transferase
MTSSFSRKPIVLSLEQALSLPYATQRFVQLGWRVIRVEATPVAGRVSKGDPNRYIGRPVAGEDRHSYYVGPNVGKEAVAINLKEAVGRKILHDMIRKLPVDVFCTNTLPGRQKELGVDFETLSALNEKLIWCSISAQGCDFPEVPGYDPALQALCGYMDLTGLPEGEPLQCGPPLIDLKAGDEVFAQTLLALLELREKGKGKKIDISMAQVAVSWLQTFLPMLDMGSPPEELRRHGNEHRQFIPVNAYPTNDGYIYIAIGSDAQWARFVEEEMFASLKQERFLSNESRRKNKDDLHRLIADVTRKWRREDISAILEKARIPHAPIKAIEEVMELDFLKDTFLETRTPEGRIVRLPPPALQTEYLEKIKGRLSFSPAYGENTKDLLREIACDSEDIDTWEKQGIIA